MKNTQISTLLSDVLKDLSEPAVAWQLGVIVIAVAVGWLGAKLLQRSFSRHDAGVLGLRLDSSSFLRFMVASFALVQVFIARQVLMHWQSVNVLRATLSLLAAMCIVRLILFILQPAIAGAGFTGRLLQFFERVLTVLVWVWFGLYVTGLWQEMVQMMDGTELTLGAKQVSVLTMLQAAISVIVTMLLALWGATLLEHRLMRIEEMHQSFRVVLSRLTRALLMLVAILFSLSLVGIDLTVLSVFGGALGVGLGFGLQKIASNYVSGFIILLERSLAIGDMIAVDKYFGRVTRIDTRFTVVRGLDGIESIIPNEMLVSNAVQNHSYTDRYIWIATDVSVGYQTDIETLLPLLEETAAGVDRVSRDRRPAATLVKFGADGLDLRVGFWISDPENGTGTVLSNVNRAIWKVLQERQVEVPYPQRVVHVIGERQQGADGARIS